MNREKLENAVQAIVVLQDECQRISSEWNDAIASISYGLEELNDLQDRAGTITDFDATDLRMMIEAMEEIEAAQVPVLDLSEV